MEEGRTGGFHDDQVENLYSTAPQVFAPYSRLDQGRVDLGTFVHAHWAGPQDLQQSTLESGSYTNLQSQYSQTWGAHGLASPQTTAHLNPGDHAGRHFDRGPASGLSYMSRAFQRDNFKYPQNLTKEEFGPLSGSSKRPISEVDEADNLDHFGSPVQHSKRRRVRYTNRTHPQATTSSRGSKKPDPAGKRKTTTRTVRRDKIQGTKAAEHNPKGMTKTNSEGQLEWRASEDKDWEPAGYHNDYRAELIALDAIEGESYSQQPAGGGASDPLNVTSYCFLQQYWSKDKSSVLDEQGREVLYMLDSPRDWVHNPRVAPMENGGMIMLDHDGYPVRDFDGVPRVLSTHIEPWRLEGLRRCTGMTLADIRARMPAQRLKGTVIMNLQTPQAFTNRMNHWRVAENVGTWLEREGSQPIKDFIKNQLPDSEVKKTESLKSLGPAQQKEVYGLNKGQYLNKSSYKHPNQEPSTTTLEGHRQTKGMKPRKKHNRRSGTETNTNMNLKRQRENRPPIMQPIDMARPFGTNNPSLQNPAASSAALEPQAAGSAHHNDDAGDYRFMSPSNAMEATSIQTALYYTRADYAFWLREEAPATSPFRSYIEQYLQLQHRLLRKWNHARGEAPTLIEVELWTGGWDMWQKPNASEEAFSRLLSGV